MWLMRYTLCEHFGFTGNPLPFNMGLNDRYIQLTEGQCSVTQYALQADMSAKCNNGLRWLAGTLVSCMCGSPSVVECDIHYARGSMIECDWHAFVCK